MTCVLYLMTRNAPGGGQVCVVLLAVMGHNLAAIMTIATVVDKSVALENSVGVVG